MSPELKNLQPVQYAAFRLRFRALVIDAAYCLGLFVIGGVVTGIVFEHSIAGRVAVFIVILAAILSYEPFMVARYGSTLGHRKSNIRVVCAASEDNLSFWRAALRSVVKGVFGLPSFLFMFVTSRAQGLHDLLAGARVVIHDPRMATGSDLFTPVQPAAGQPPAWGRRLVITLIYNALLLFFLTVAATFVSSACTSQKLCSDSESRFLVILGGVWLVLVAASIVLGCAGRLPGCRPRSQN
jgi:uncharacterized RDD family membrane protein YckC